MKSQPWRTLGSAMPIALKNSFSPLAAACRVEDEGLLSTANDGFVIVTTLASSCKKRRKHQSRRRPTPAPAGIVPAKPAAKKPLGPLAGHIEWKATASIVALILLLPLLFGFLGGSPGLSKLAVFKAVPSQPQTAIAKHPVVIIPGFITSHLEVHNGRSCAHRGRVWGSLSMLKFLTKITCWMDHLSLGPAAQDPSGIKVRAVAGVDGAQDFVQGFTIWGKVISTLTSVGYNSSNMKVLPYDWRVDMSRMESRDGWFSTTRSTIESVVNTTGHKAVMLSHSYGENVARAFIHWMEVEVPGWVEAHLYSHVAVAGPSLGLPKALACIMSGEMRDTAQLGPVATMIADALIPRSSRMKLLRSWTSLLGMLPVGGPKVWGNASWAPDDSHVIRQAGRTHGPMITTTVPHGLTGLDDLGSRENTKLNVGRATQLALHKAGLSPTHKQYLPTVTSGMCFLNASQSASSQVVGLPVLPNPLVTPLPDAPSLRLFYLYGVGVPTERAFHYASTFIDTQVQDAKSGLENGVQLADGDLTVPLLSLGGLSRGAWRTPRLNPAGIQVITKEYKHQPVSPLLDLRGGPATAAHIDILLNHEVLADIVSVATGADTVHTRIVSEIDSIVSRIPFNEPSGWE